MISFKEYLTEQYGDFDDVKEGDKVRLWKLHGGGVKRMNSHTVTKVLDKHFVIDHKDDQGRPLKFHKRNGKGVSNKDLISGRGGGTRGFEAGYSVKKEEHSK